MSLEENVTVGESSISKASRDSVEASQQIVTFKLGDEEYGVDIMKVQEIILMGELTQVPEVPDFIKGVINLRGNVIPIISLRKRFSLPEVPVNEETRIIVVNVGEKTMGVVVDAVNEVLRVNGDSVEDPPATIAGLGRTYLRGLIKLTERLLILLDLNQVLDLQKAEAGQDSQE